MQWYINENGITSPFKAELLVMNLPSDFLKKCRRLKKKTQWIQACPKRLQTHSKFLNILRFIQK
jgi:hypothetical protein